MNNYLFTILALLLKVLENIFFIFDQSLSMIEYIQLTIYVKDTSRTVNILKRLCTNQFLALLPKLRSILRGSIWIWQLHRPPTVRTSFLSVSSKLRIKSSILDIIQYTMERSLRSILGRDHFSHCFKYVAHQVAKESARKDMLVKIRAHPPSIKKLW